MNLLAAAAAAFWLAAPAMAQNNPVQTPDAGSAAQAVPAQSTFVERAAPANSLPERLNANTVTIISGNPNGTYLFFAYDMSAVLDNGNSLRVLPIVGKGAGQNTKDLLYLTGVDMGITQSDILSHFNKTGELGANIAGRLRYICRLYNEEMHVLATPGIRTVADLEGKKVNFSDEGSGTQISSRLIFDALGIEVEEVNMGETDAFEAITRGEIAATVAFGGKPTGAFSKIEADPAKYKLIEVPYPAVLHQDYLPSTLTHADYPQLIPEGRTVETIAVGSVLAVFNWASDSERYRRVATFTEALFENFDRFLEKPRHPKWREVNLAATLPGWNRFTPAQEVLDRDPGLTVARNAGEDISQFVTGTTSATKPLDLDKDKREELFRSFIKWKERLQDR
jgi:TRAP transporter TAXI family solute receptor